MRSVPDPSMRHLGLVNARDLALLAVLPVYFLLAWCLPERHWPGLTVVIAPALRKIGIRNRHLPKTVARFLGQRAAPDQAAAIANRYAANYQLDRLYLLRHYARPRLRSEIRLEGAARIENALRTGHGVILWVAPFVHRDLSTKIALKINGFDAIQLTHPAHGFSTTAFGIRFLNPVRTNAEGRYLAERIVIGAGGPAVATVELSRRLKRNGIVLISALNRRTSDVKTVAFLDGTVTLPAGPCRLSAAMEAPLLPVVTVRLHDGTFVTTIGEPLLQGTAASEATIEDAIGRFAAFIGRQATEFPDQFRWHEVVRAPGAATRQSAVSR